jgi:EmrB/QacA subfamily drug resistance transporter
MAGEVLGGILTRYLGWEWIFFVNVPVGAIALALTPRFVRESRAERESSPDVFGAVAVTSGLALLVYAVSTAPSHHWGSAKTLLLLAGAAALLGAFLVIEARTKDPLMPFHIFRIRTVAGANISALLLGASLFANFFLLTLYVQEVLGWSALKTGLTFIATAGSAVLWAGVAQGLVTRFGAKPIMVIGFIGMHAGMLWYTTIPVHGSYWSDLLPGYLIIGFAIPFAFIPVSIAALAGIEHHEAGLASGIFNTAQQIGGAVGVAVVSSVQISRFDHLVSTDGFAKAFTSGTRYGFWACVAVSVFGLLAVLALVRRDELAHVDEAEAAALG